MSLEGAGNPDLDAALWAVSIDWLTEKFQKDIRLVVASTHYPVAKVANNLFPV